MKTIIQIGLDFGTTNTGIAVKFDDGTVELLKSYDVNMKSFPSEIYFTNKNTVFVGTEAQKKAESSKGEGRHIRWIKRSLPRKLDLIKIFSRTYSIEDLVSIIIKHAKEKVEQKLKIDWNNVKLNVGYPVMLGENNEQNELAKNRLQKALKLSGFNSWELIPEPLAVAIFYSNKIKSGRKCLIFDCGGGTTDLSFVEYDKKISSGFRILGSDGIMIAGRDYDKSLFLAELAPHLGYRLPYNFMDKKVDIPDILYSIFSNSREAHKLVLPTYYKHIVSAVKIGKLKEYLNFQFAVDKNKSTYLLTKAENLKIQLSSAEIVKMDIFLDKHFTVATSYSKFFDSAFFVQNKIINMVQSFCKDKPEPDFIVMTGGMSNHRIIRSMMHDQLKSIPENCFLYENTDAIVLGLASMD